MAVVQLRGPVSIGIWLNTFFRYSFWLFTRSTRVIEFFLIHQDCERTCLFIWTYILCDVLQTVSDEKRVIRLDTIPEKYYNNQFEKEASNVVVVGGSGDSSSSNELKKLNLTFNETISHICCWFAFQWHVLYRECHAIQYDMG